MSLLLDWRRPLMAVGLVLAVASCGGDDGPSASAAAPMPGVTAACGGGILPAEFSDTLPRAGNHSTERLDLAVMLLTNQARCANGVPPLIGNPALRQAAYLHSQDMARLEFFAHDSPVPGRETLGRRLDQVGMAGRGGSENIINGRYMAYKSGRRYSVLDASRCQFVYENGDPIAPHSYASMAVDIVDRWMNSPVHRRNILKASMKQHGFALAPSKTTSLCGGVLATQVFSG